MHARPRGHRRHRGAAWRLVAWVSFSNGEGGRGGVSGTFFSILHCSANNEKTSDARPTPRRLEPPAHTRGRARGDARAPRGSTDRERWTVWTSRLRSRFASGWVHVTSRDHARCVGSSMRWRTTTRCGAGCLRASRTRSWARTSFPRLPLHATTREASRSVCTCATAGGSTARSIATARVTRATTRSSRRRSRIRRTELRARRRVARGVRRRERGEKRRLFLARRARHRRGARPPRRIR